jgi:hypothetical protein
MSAMLAAKGHALPLLDVLVDVGCPTEYKPALVALRAQIVDVADEHFTLPHGGFGAVLLVGSKTAAGVPSFIPLRSLRNRFPQLVVIICSESPNDYRFLPLLARAGADEVLMDAGPHDPDNLVQLVIARSIAPPPAQEMLLLHKTQPDTWERFAVEYCIRCAYRPGTGRGIAQWLGVADRTLRARLQKQGYPSPQQCLRAGRFLHVAELADRGITSRSEQSFRLGFTDSTDMRKKKWLLQNASRDDPAFAAFVRRFPRLRMLLEGG